jgi:flavin-dependent thymidylate synthase
MENVLGDNIGFINLVSSMGDDLTVVNAARVSYSGRSESFTDKDKKLVRYLLKNNHSCYDEETEVYTKEGWKYWRDVTDKDELASVISENEFTFEKPKRLVCSEYNGEMYNFKAHTLDLLVTPNHNVYISRRTSKGYGDYYLERADQTPKEFRMKLTSKYVSKEKGSDNDFYFGCLYGMFIGDGRIWTKNKINFRFKRNRKIKYLEFILRELNIEYEKIKQKDGVTEFRFVNPNPNVFVGDSKTKRINRELSLLNDKIREGIVDGLKASGGSVKRNTWMYSSSSVNLIKDVQDLLTLEGLSSKINKFGIGVFPLMILTENSPIFDSRAGEIKKRKYIGKIYCAEVSSGKLLVRRNGYQSISGNSPLEHVQFTLNIKTPLFVERQWNRHRTWKYFSLNEVSRRYSSQNIEFYIPKEFRLQSDDNKQMSSKEVLDPTETVIFYQRIKDQCRKGVAIYQEMIDKGVAREMARGVLCQFMYVNFYGTVDLHNLLWFLELRRHPHAQEEIRRYAFAIENIIKEVVPFTYQAWEENIKEKYMEE